MHTFIAQHPRAHQAVDEASSYAGRADHCSLSRLDNWFSCQNLTEALLIVTNFLLLLKSSANLFALYTDSRSLIVEYNAALLLNGHFEWCIILLNGGLFVGSLLCLVALLLALPTKTKAKLIKCFAITQLCLAVFILAFMGKLWFAPFKIELDDSVWHKSVQSYTYYFEADSSGLLPNGRLAAGDYATSGAASAVAGAGVMEKPSASVRLHDYSYPDALDRLQQALGCCGLWGPDEWRSQNELGLLAPSCCPNPVGLQVAASSELSSGRPTATHYYYNDRNQTGAAGGDSSSPSRLFFASAGYPADSSSIYPSPYRAHFFYCQSARAEIGCQRLLSEREVFFLFNFRLALLLLLAIVLLNIVAQAALKFYPDSSQMSLRSVAGGQWTASAAANMSTTATRLRRPTASSGGRRPSGNWRPRRHRQQQQHHHHHLVYHAGHQAKATLSLGPLTGSSAPPRVVLATGTEGSKMASITIVGLTGGPAAAAAREEKSIPLTRTCVPLALQRPASLSSRDAVDDTRPTSLVSLGGGGGDDDGAAGAAHCRHHRYQAPDYYGHKRTLRNFDPLSGSPLDGIDLDWQRSSGRVWQTVRTIR